MKDLETSPAQAEPHLRKALQAAKVGAWEYDPRARAAKADAQTSSLFRLAPEDSGWAPLDQFALAIHGDDVARVLDKLEARDPFEATFRIADETGGVRWLRAVGEWGGPAGEERLFGVTYDDTPERARSEELALLVGEMRHRVGNAFSIIAGLIGIEARRTDEASALAEALRARLASLARAQALTYERNPFGDGLTFGDLVRTVGEPFTPNAETRLQVSGGETPLSDAARAALGLVFYEWFTNALKYGALSVADGQVDVSARSEGGLVAIEWAERGGPAPSAAPERNGFGDRLCASALAKLGGGLQREVRAEGMFIRATLDAAHVAPDPLS